MIKGFPLKAKSFQNTATYKNLQGWVPSPQLQRLVSPDENKQTRKRNNKAQGK